MFWHLLGPLFFVLITLASPTPAAADFGLPPCANEDGPGPCFWDAGLAGNGAGYSFWIDCTQSAHYLDPAADAQWGGPYDGYPEAC